MVTVHAHLLVMWLDLSSLNQPGPSASYSLVPVHTWHGMGMALGIYGARRGILVIEMNLYKRGY